MCRLDIQNSDISRLGSTITALQSTIEGLLKRIEHLEGSAGCALYSESDQGSQKQCYSTAVAGVPTSMSTDPPTGNTTTNASGARMPLNEVPRAQQSCPDNRKSNLVIIGIPECDKGSRRYLRQRADLERAGELLSGIDPFVTANSIRVTACLGKYNEDRSRPLLITLTRANDVQSILSNRRLLADRPGIRIKPDLSLAERKNESVLLKERWSLIQAGTERSSINISGNHLFINKQKYGTASDGKFVCCSNPDSETTTKEGGLPSTQSTSDQSIHSPRTNAAASPAPLTGLANSTSK